MKISKKTRPARAGKLFGEAVAELVNLMYLNDNALEFLCALVFSLKKELNKRKRQWVK